MRSAEDAMTNTNRSNDVHGIRRQMSRWWMWILLAGVLIAAIVPRVTHGQSKTSSPQRSASSPGGGSRNQQPRAVPVVAVAAKKGDMPVYLTGLGTVTALQTITVRSRVDGQLMKVAFREGQFVRPGDVLAELDPRPFQVQLEQAEGQKAKDEAALENARRDLERYEVLVEQDSIPRQQLDTQRATVAQDEATLKSDQAQIDSARLNLTYARITAQIPGRIGLRLVDVGNIVRATDQNGLAIIAQISPIAVIFTIPEDSLAQVLPKTRAGVRLPVDAFDRDMKARLATGSLLTTDNEIDQTTGTIKLKAQFSNMDEKLFPNQFVNARLLVDTLRGIAIIPGAAIQRTAQSTFVYRVKPDSTVEMRPIVVALTEGDQAAVRQGLVQGDVVVTDGLDKLQQGMKVAVRAPGQ